MTQTAGMTIKGKAYIAGAYEHPTRHAPDKTVAQFHAESARGRAGEGCGADRADVDGYFCSGDAPGPCPASIADYMNLRLCHMNSPRSAALLILRMLRMPPKRSRSANATSRWSPSPDVRAPRPWRPHAPRPRSVPAEAAWEAPGAVTTPKVCHVRDAPHVRVRHHQEQLAWVKVAASHHAQQIPTRCCPRSSR